MNAIKLLCGQHREIRRLLQQLTDELEAGSAMEEIPPPLPDLDDDAASEAAFAVVGQELRETSDGAVIGVESARDAFPVDAYAVTAASERVRVAEPPPTELDGHRPEAVPGRQFRDYAGHLEDGRTHVGLDAEQLPAQMYVQGTHAFRPDSAIGAGRESTAGSAEQFDNVSMVLNTHGRTGLAHALVGGAPFAWSGDVPVRPRLSPEEKYARFQQIVELLAAHIVIEEQVLYAIAADVAPDLLEEVRHDQRMLKRGLAELRSQPVSSKHFELRLQSFAEEAERHFEDEEGELFPRLQEQMGTAQLERIGARMGEQWATLVGHSQYARPPQPPPEPMLGDALAGQPTGTVHARPSEDVAPAPPRQGPATLRGQR